MFAHGLANVVGSNVISRTLFVETFSPDTASTHFEINSTNVLATGSRLSQDASLDNQTIITLTENGLGGNSCIKRHDMAVFEPLDRTQPLWVILKAPLDGSAHPHYEVVMYIIRCRSHQSSSDPQHIGSFATLESARTCIPEYAIYADRSEGDPPEVVESWI